MTPARAGAPVGEPAQGSAGPVWIPAVDGYELTLDGDKLVCRNAKGKVLRSVPKPARESDAAEHLRALRDWLARHEAACRATVEAWMLGSMPVPSAVIATVWPDPAWRAQLDNLVVATGDGTDRVAGFLRGVDEAGRAGVVNLDGETEWLAAESLVIPHPVLLDDLDELREFALELGIEQQARQLLREVHHKPDDPDDAREQASAFANGRFKELRHALARASNLGFRVRGGYATCRAFDGGVPVEARYWLGADAPEWESMTGELIWVDIDEKGLDLASVGPVAWSEGIRMAALVFAGRVEEGNE
jgi:hypothetical protein